MLWKYSLFYVKNLAKGPMVLDKSRHLQYTIWKMAEPNLKIGNEAIMVSKG